MNYKIIFLLIVISLLIVSCTSSNPYSNPNCHEDSECKSLSTNARCMSGTCQLPSSQDIIDQEILQQYPDDLNEALEEIELVND